MDDKQKEKDAVTVGQIRARMMFQLEREIDELNRFIRNGYHELPKAHAHLKDTISDTLAKMQNLNGWASTEIIFPPAPNPKDHP